MFQKSIQSISLGDPNKMINVKLFHILYNEIALNLIGNQWQCFLLTCLTKATVSNLLL